MSMRKSLESDYVNDESSCSTSTSQSTAPSATRKTNKHRSRNVIKTSPRYKYDSHYREDHGTVIYCVCFNDYLPTTQPPIFVAVGSNRCTVYECLLKGGIKLTMCFSDPDLEENFFTCTWTQNTWTSSSLIAAAGNRGVIRVIDLEQHDSVCNLIGHGGAINELKTHPIQPHLLLSCSKDHAVRLWNVQTHTLVAIFGGVDGHRAEVLAIDFDLRGERIVSGGMDHALKIWNINSAAVNEKIKLSAKFQGNVNKSGLHFPVFLQHYPDFSTREIHGNYVDCVRWFGDMLISKSCQNQLIFWRISDSHQIAKPKRSDKSSTEIISQFKCDHSELWFVRFGFNFWRNFLALGNDHGKILVWELSPSGPEHTRHYVLSKKGCYSTVRHVSFSKNGEVLVGVCDDGTIWRWNRTENRKRNKARVQE